MDLTSEERISKYGALSQKGFIELRHLKDLVNRGEGITIEFKLKASHPEKIVKEVVALANTEGGVLIIGVGDDKKIEGLKFVDEEEYILVRAIQKYCFPSLAYQLKGVELADGREVLLFEIQKSKVKPHYVQLTENTNVQEIYVRVADKSIKASKEMRRILIGETKGENVKFSISEKEKQLFKYLDEHTKITVTDYSKFAHLPLWLASKTLVLLTLANVLKIIPDEIQDYFERK